MTVFRRCALTAVPFGVATAAYIGVFLASYDRLPGRIATHFSGGGGADGFTSRTAALWFGSGLLVGLGLLFTVLVLMSKESPGGRLTAAVGAGTAVTLGYPLEAVVFPEVIDAFALVGDRSGGSVGVVACRVVVP
ncbi:DUF1648 domain-containing protein, partial [Streptomyces sp. AK04-3B]|uniref:DUF1648 domain-containing protein n=1 Tax=Streptomyces sp. AK04-3B TaxID=3028650 RepID=UPI0029B81387